MKRMRYFNYFKLLHELIIIHVDKKKFNYLEHITKRAIYINFYFQTHIHKKLKFSSPKLFYIKYKSLNRIVNGCVE